MNKVLICLFILVSLASVSVVDGRRAARGRGRRGARNRKRHKAPRKARKQKSSDDVKDPTSRDIDPVFRHGLTIPMEQSFDHWLFGGSTVMTDRMARLTPHAQDRGGWLFNRHPLQSESFEVEVDLQVFSEPHFGGDGMAIWFLDPVMEAQLSYSFRGPIFGMVSDFKGVGLLIDVYDNNLLRDNPGIYVLTNFEGQDREWDIESDFKNTMWTKTPAHTPGHEAKRTNAYYKAHQCVAELRNTGRASKLMIKYVENILHVYVNVNQKAKIGSYKFCLAVEMPRDQTLTGKHVALTAATGQVADNHDILRITTKYLGANPELFDDTQLPELDHEHSTQHRFFQINILPPLLLFATALLLTGLGGGLVFLIVSSKGVDEFMVLPNLNTLLKPYYAAQALALLVCFFTEYYYFCFAHLLVFGSHVYKFVNKTAYFNHKSLREGALVLPVPLPAHWELYVSEVIYVMMLLCRLVELFFD